MSNFASTKTELLDFLRARPPLIIVDSQERGRVERLLREIAAESTQEILYYTDATQVKKLGGYSTSISADSDPTVFALEHFKTHKKTVFVIGDAKRISEENYLTQEILSLVFVAQTSENTLVLVTGDPVWARLAQLGVLAVLSLPDQTERTMLVERFVSEYKNAKVIDWNSDDIRRIANLMNGFSEIQIQNILKTIAISRDMLTGDDIGDIMRQKDRLYAVVPSVDKIQLDDGIVVSGLEVLKEWLIKKQKVFFAPDEQLAKRSLGSPKGLLLVGVPGCGKSFCAKMIAHEWSLPLLRFDIGTVFDKWVGESERRMKDALAYVDNVAPCVLWVDEIEKGLSSNDDSNGTAKRILGQFLFWLSESKSKVFLVATANDVSRMQPELFRKGRFSEVFFIDLPSAVERAEALELYVEKCLGVTFNEEEMAQLIEVSEGFSYSDIECAVKELAEAAIVEGEECVTYERLIKCFKSVVPIEAANPEDISFIRQWGSERAVNASLRN